MTQRWTLHGADRQTILGNTHLPSESPRGVVIIAHGFKGYKDYGMLPRIAQRCADAGFIAHRFNFSHSGMTDAIDTFERPELFERDTWNKQVQDIVAIINALGRGELAGGGLPYVLLGHSRGGVAALLTAGRHADDATFVQPAGVITLASPDRCNSLSEDDAALLLRRGYLESPSARTGQTLRVGSAFLREQLDSPAEHDVLGLVSRITCPMLFVHGEDDPTVPAVAASHLATAAKARISTLIVPGADHVFNTPNPRPDDAPESPQLAAAMSAILDFLRTMVA